MKIQYILVVVLCLSVFCCPQDSNAFQDGQAKQDDKAKQTGRFGTAEENKLTADGNISFTFNDQDWEDVIKWFAAQADYSLQEVSEWPQGTFNLVDKDEYTVLEALDQLNHALRRLRPEPYTLVRNRKMLILAKLEDSNFPDDLIEIVKVEDLDKRGKYETIRCKFDLGELNSEDMYDQIIPLVNDRNRGSYAVFPSANQIHIRESGAQLREIRDLIETARNRKLAGELDLIVYKLKHEDSESFMAMARDLLGIPQGANIRDDEKLAITVEPFGERLFVQGTKEYLTKFEQIAAKIDAPPEAIEGVAELDEPRLKQYPVLTDPKQAFLTLETMLEGREGVKMGQDENTGAITILGREDDHAMAKATLDTLAGAGADGFALIQLKNADPVDVIMALQSLFRQTAEENSGPVMLGDSDKNQIIVRGTPQEVNQVKIMVDKMDANAIPSEPMSRSDRRIIPLDDRQQDKILPMLEDLLGATNRRNRINIVMPKDRKNYRNRYRSNLPSQGSEAPVEVPGLSPEDQQLLRDLQRDSSQNQQPAQQNKSSQIKTIANDLFLIASAKFTLPAATSFLAYQDDEVGKSSEETKETGPQNSAGYIPPAPIDSVPNAPIEAKFTEYGLVLISKDLDALDDLEYIIGQQFDTDSVTQEPQLFFLEHRGADDMLELIESFFGIADSGGGGGSGGNIMGSMMSNMMGGGDLLGGLLGGAEGSDAGFLEGEVKFGVDMRFNALYVRGATDNDLDQIYGFIEIFDKPDPPHEPDTLGEFRTIDVIHRDPTELKELIEGHLSDLVDTGEAAGGASKQNNEMIQMAKAMQAITGGGKKGTDTSNLAEKKPKVKLSVDESTSQILVTGPEFIYKKILEMVIQLDTPQETPDYMRVNGDTKAIISTLQAMFPDQLEIVGADGSTSTAAPGGSSTGKAKTGGTSNTAAAAASKAQSDAIRNAIFSNMRNQARSQGGGGARGGATSGRGGGGGGRGGRGR